MNFVQRVLVAVVALLVLPLICVAQINTGRITGNVHDANGAVIVGAKVIVTNDATGVVTSRVTESVGDYLINFLLPGTYTVEVECPGFKKLLMHEVAVNAGGIFRLDVTLTVGQQIQTIQVESNPLAVATETSELSQTISAVDVKQFPNIDRNPVYQLTTLPGANSGTGSGNYGSNGGENGSAIGLTRAQLVSIGGVDANANGVFIEGMLNREPQNGYVGVMPTVEDVQEVQVYTGKYNAEYGFSGSAVINVVTKSGTNQLHGALFEYARDSSLDAQNFFAKAPTPFRRNQFGGALGGPVKKDKLFFFADYQGTRFNNSAPGTTTAPTDKMYQGDFSELYQPGQPLDNAGNEAGQLYDPFTRVLAADGSVVSAQPFPGNIIPASRWDPAAKAMNAAQLWGKANLPGTSHNQYYIFSNLQEVHQGDGRADYNLSDKNRFFFRYSHLYSTDDNSSSVNQFYQKGQADSRTANRNFQLTHLALLSPRISNEIRIGYNRTNVVTSGKDVGTPWNNKFGIPNGNVTDPASVGIVAPSISPLHSIASPGWVGHIITNTFAFTENFSWEKGKHRMKFGAYISNVGEVNADTWPSPRGQIGFGSAMTSFDGISRPYAYPSFLLGTMTSTQRSGWTKGVTYDTYWQNAWYAQDDFKVTSTLTLNLGLRYELASLPVERHNRNSNWDSTKAELVVATGSNRAAGLKGDHNDWGPRVGFAWSPDHGKTSLRGGFGVSYWQAYWVGPLSSLPETYPFFAINEFDTPNNLTPTLSLSKDGLPLATAVYDNSGKVLIPAGAVIHGTSVDWKNQGVYQGTLNVQRSIRGVVADIGYWHVHGSHNVTNLIYGGSVNANQAPPQPPGADYNLARPYRSKYPQLGDVPVAYSTASSNYDALTASVTAKPAKLLTLFANYAYARDFANGNNLDPSNINQYYGPTQADIPSSFNAQFNVQLPIGHGQALLGNVSRPLDLIVGGWQFSGFLHVASGPRFDVYSGVSLLNNGQGNRPNRLCSGKISHPTIQKWYDASCFVDDQVPETYGNAGINPLHSDGLQQLDSSLMKTLSLSERIKLEVRADLFNTFNHPNFAAPDSTVNDGSTGQVFATSVDQRRSQFGARFSF